MSPAESGLDFINALQPDEGLNILQYDYFYNGGGVAAADFDNDGLTDLFFTGNQTGARIYLNEGNLHFRDVTRQSGIVTNGWCTGVSIADVNADGWQDIYVCHAGLRHTPNQLFINKGRSKGGNITFIEKTHEYGLAYQGYSTQAAFADFDKDGDTDMYLLTHLHSKRNPNYPGEKINDGASPGMDGLFVNDGKGKFVDESKARGIVHEGYGLGLAIADLNGDGWSDIYVANDFATDDVLYINNKDGTFTNKLAESVAHTSRYSMGCDIADVNNDLLPDIFVADMMPYENRRLKLMSPGLTQDVFNFSLERGYMPQYSRNMLQLHNGILWDSNISFSEIGQLAGVEKTDWSWSALFADFDNDGWKDLFVTNGIPHDVTNQDFTSYRSAEFAKDNFDYETVLKKLLASVDKLEPVALPNILFRNNGDHTFTDKSDEWKTGDAGFSNGAAIADLDNDGDLDIVTSNINAAPFLYRNNTERKVSNFLQLKFDVPAPVGIKVHLFAGGVKQLGELNPYRGFQSTQQNILHFGLGTESIIDSLRITWPDGKFQWMKNLKANRLLRVRYEPDSSELAVRSEDKFVFSDVTAETRLNLLHSENKFEDFDGEPLLPHRYSRNGPYFATGDVNGDGLDDFWMGAPAMLASKIFVQRKDGRFNCMEMPDRGYEDMDAVFFDADGDQDADLYVVSGGNEYNAFSAPYQDRLYVNDGTGLLTRNREAIPHETSSGCIVVTEDYDKDGDQDLFVGGRVVPAKYGMSPQSLLLNNDGRGKFTDLAATMSGNLQYAGMITAAEWVDVDNDGWKDLVIAGEWTPVIIFKNNKGRLSRIQTNIDKITGWWFSLQAADFDNDGDEDLLAGNLGLNNKFDVSDESPLRAYIKDFDRNGSEETIFTYFVKGKEYPVAGRDQLASVYPAIKKRFETYARFAGASFSEIFSDEELKASKRLEANCLTSVYIENQGNGHFKVHPLPIEAQFSTIQDILVKDFNTDGYPDAVIIGNFYSPDYVTGQYDASVGLLLTSTGSNSFKPERPFNSGLALKGDMRSAAFIEIKDKSCFIAAPNSGKVQIIQIH